MSIITLILTLFVILLFVKCQQTGCTRDNIFEKSIDIIKQISGYLFDVFSYAIKRFTEIHWMEGTSSQQSIA